MKPCKVDAAHGPATHTRWRPYRPDHICTDCATRVEQSIARSIADLERRLPRPLSAEVPGQETLPLDGAA